MAWLLLILIGVSGLHAGTREEMDRRVTQLRIAGDLPAAIAVLTSWIDEHRNDEEVRLRLGQLYLHSGNSDRALMTWQLLLRELTPDADRWRQIASRLRRAGMTEEAIGLLEEAPSPVALDGTLAWELAELYLEVGRYAAAVTTHFRQVRREPRRRSLLENRIAALAAQDRRFGAQRAGETRCQRYCDEFRSG